MRDQLAEAKAELDRGIGIVIMSRNKIRKFERLLKVEKARAGGKDCPNCDGTGFRYAPSAPAKPCLRCGGTGKI